MTEIGMALGNPLHAERLPGSVGVPFPGVSVRLVDEHGDAVPDHTAGAIEVAGATVFQEYWRRPEATRAAQFEHFCRTRVQRMRSSTTPWAQALGRSVTAPRSQIMRPMRRGRGLAPEML